MTNTQHELETPAGDLNASSHSIPALSIAWSDHLRVRFGDLEKSLSIVRAARDGFSGIDGRIKRFEVRRDELQKQLQGVEGSIAAARAMGLPESARKADIDVPSVRAELASIEVEVQSLQSAKASAPDLFEPLLADVRSKLAGLKSELAKEAAAPIIDYVKRARAVAEQIRSEAQYLERVATAPDVIGWPRPDGAIADPNMIATLSSWRSMIELATQEDRPLVQPVEKPVNIHDLQEETIRRQREVETINIQAAKKWHADREARERDEAAAAAAGGSRKA